LLHGQIKKGRLILTFGLHGFLIRLHTSSFKYFCRDFVKSFIRNLFFVSFMQKLGQVNWR